MSPAPRRPGMAALRRALYAIGDGAIGPALGAWTVLGVGAATVIQGARPAVWRRTVRAELVRHLSQMGLSALPAVLILGGLSGLGIVAQAVYRLGLFGQSEQVGPVLVLVLVRELAPLLVALLVIGRSASVSLADLHELRASGRLRALDAMGIDPFHLLVLPRAYAMATCCFALTIAFLAAALVLGFVGSSAAGITPLPFVAFVNEVLGNMGPAEYALLVAKPVLIGFTVALVTCVVALKPHRSGDGLHQLLPRGMAAATVAAFLISGALSVLL